MKIHTEGHNNKMVVISVIDQIKVKTSGAHCMQTQKGEEYHLYIFAGGKVMNRWKICFPGYYFEVIQLVHK